MNRTDRLLAIVLEIQARKQVRAEDLAAIFEVTKRTIYRDIQALAEAGVPIVAVTGQGYSLVEGYFLPPLSFSSDEAIMLLLGTDFVGQNLEADARGVAQSARHKIVTVLPEPLRREVEYLESNMRFVAINGAVAPQTLQRLRQAILQHRRVRFRYHARARDNQPQTATLRDADPYALIHAAVTWILIAYCHLRQDRRHFRLDRMEEVTLLEQSFTRPADFKIERADEPLRTTVVRVRFDQEIARWVRETPSFFQVAQMEDADGLLVTLTIDDPSDILHWLLSWGSHARVLEPDSLREAVAREAAAMLANHTGSGTSTEGKTLLT